MPTPIAVALISGGFTVLAALVGVVAARQSRQTKALGAVHEQVANTHKTNLREDMDQVLAGLDRVLGGQARHDKEISGIRSDIGGIRAEIRHEREERLDVERRLADHIADPDHS